MNLRFSSIVFMVAYCVAYVAALALELPLFRYYPLGGDLTWAPLAAKGLGPAMAWYGIMASAGIVAVVLAVLVPDRWLDKPLRNRLWLFPVGAMLGCSYLMKIFFL